jgi:hypothetical protein
MWSAIHEVQVREPQPFTVTTVSLLVKDKNSFLADPSVGMVLKIGKKRHGFTDADWEELGSLCVRREELDFLIQVLEEDCTTSAVHFSMHSGIQIVDKELEVTRKWINGLKVYQLVTRQAKGPHNSPKQTGFVAYKWKELVPLLKVLRGFRDLMYSWFLFKELKYEGAIHSMALIFWSAFKRVADPELVLKVYNDFSLLNKLAPFLCVGPQPTVSQEMQQIIALEEPISEFLYMQAQKLGMDFLASTVSL